MGKGKTAPDLWAMVDDVNHNQANLFAGDVWTHHKFKADFWVEGKRPDEFQMPQRITEILCAQRGYGHPESPFKLIGAKQVGKGGLAGMRLAHYLKQHHGSKIAIWPFDDHDACDNATIVMTEIYPRQFIKRAGLGNQKLRTIDDLNTGLLALQSFPFNQCDITDHDTDAIIAAAGLRYLCGDHPIIPNDISIPHENRLTLMQEGWIFGV